MELILVLTDVPLLFLPGKIPAKIGKAFVPEMSFKKLYSKIKFSIL